MTIGKKNEASTYAYVHLLRIEFAPRRGVANPHGNNDAAVMIIGARRTSKSRWRRFMHVLVRTVRGALLLQDTPHRIAVGCGAGIFCGALPILGQTLVGIVVARVLGGNVIASLPWNLISNPFTYAPIFYVGYRFGMVVTPGDWELVSFARIGEIMERFQRLSMADGFSYGYEVLRDIFVPLMVGCVLMGVLAGLAMYVVCRHLVMRLQERRRLRLNHWRERSILSSGPPPVDGASS